MKARRFSRLLLFIVGIITGLFTIAVYLFPEMLSSVSAQANTSATEQMLNNALPKQSDLAPGWEWVKNEVIIKPTSGGYHAVSTISGCKSCKCKYRIYQISCWSCTIHIDYYYDAKAHSQLESPDIFRSSGIVSNYVRYEGLPGGLIQETSSKLPEPLTRAYYGHGCHLYCWRSPQCYVYLFSNAGTTFDKDCEPPYCTPFTTRFAEAKIFSRSEAERLAKLVWSRLPDEKGKIAAVPPVTPAQPGASSTTTSGTSQPSQPPSSSEAGKIPDSALPIAVGATAAVALLGAWLTLFAQGIPSREAIGELVGLFRGELKPSSPEPINWKKDAFETVDTLNKEDPKPRPDQVAELQYESSSSLYTPGQRPPEITVYGYDSAGNLIEPLEKETSDQIEPSHEEQMPTQVGTSEDGEASAEELEQAMDELKKERKGPEPQSASPVQFETISQEVRDMGSLNPQWRDVRVDELHDATRLIMMDMIKDGYWVRNPGNSSVMDSIYKLLYPEKSDNSEILHPDEKGLRCGDFVILQEKPTAEIVERLFGPGAIVDQVSVDIKPLSERTWDPTLHNISTTIFGADHTALRVITPDGRAYMVDYWQARQGIGQLVQTEEEWAAHWMEECGYGHIDNALFKDANADENTLINFISKCDGDTEKGMAMFREKRLESITGVRLTDGEKQELIKAGSIESYFKTEEGSRLLNNITDEKKKKLFQVDTLQNYFKWRGNKFGYTAEDLAMIDIEAITPSYFFERW